MKSIGTVRKVDELGRIVIPIELRRNLGIGERDALEIFVDGDRVVLQKYLPGCQLCGSMQGVITAKGKRICDGCLENFNEAADEESEVR